MWSFWYSTPTETSGGGGCGATNESADLSQEEKKNEYPEIPLEAEGTSAPEPVPISNFQWVSYPDTPGAGTPPEAHYVDHGAQESSFFTRWFSVSSYTGSATKEEGNAYGVSEHQRQGLWSLLSDSLGSDIVNITMPVWLFEPTTFITRMVEVTEFDDLLIKAASRQNSLEKLLYVSVFAGTAFVSTERFGKPFNSVLGETFEYVKKNGSHILAEQVSHHPPVGAMVLEHKQFKLWQDSTPKTKLLGNSIDVLTNARTHITFTGSDDHFFYTTPKTRAHNILIGRTWIDHYGDLTVTNLTTGEKCVLDFKKCGWLGKGRYELEGAVYDKEGNPKISVWGKWNEVIYGKWHFDGGDKPKDKEVSLWKRPSNYSSGKWKITSYGQKILAIDSELEKHLPSTDARLRPDRRELEQDNQSKASQYKHIIEEKQREDRRAREMQGLEWQPRYFQQVEDFDGVPIWEYAGKYWEEREQRIRAVSAGQEVKHNAGVEDLACDFRSRIMK